MEAKQREELRQAYSDACNNYLKAWCEKHDLPMEDDPWVAQEPGGIALIGDYFVDMQTILTDIDMDAPEEEWWNWYDYSLETSEVGLPDKCNFKSWLMGCPRYSEEALERIAELRKSVNKAQDILERAIKEEVDKLGSF